MPEREYIASLAEHHGSLIEPVYTLKQAARRFFPDGPLTASSLRSEIRKGRLQATMPAGKLLVTESALVEMLEACRVNVSHPTCTSTCASRTNPTSGGSETERIARAQAALKPIFQARKKR
jgi:hypothetical protein